MKIKALTLQSPAPFLLGEASLSFRLVTDDDWERSYVLTADFFTLAMIVMFLAEEKIDEALKCIERYKAEGKLKDGKP